MILMYHKVHPTSPSMWWVEVDHFYRQMWELQSYRVVTLDDYDAADPDHAVITFDGVYDNVLRYAAPIMERFGYPFELFVTGDTMGGDNAFDRGEPAARFADAAELERLQHMGGRVQWHTRSHPDMSRLSDTARIAAELEVPAALRAGPGGCRWFAYPYGRFDDRVRAEVSTRFVGAVSCDVGSDDDRFTLLRRTVTNETSFRRGSVSCIIASYNYGGLLTEAVESVLRQTIPPQEILISDDCSHDETQAVAREFASQYPDRIRYNRNERNLGIVDHFNRAVSLVSGDYVVILGGDNRLRSNYVEDCAALLERGADVAIAYTDVDLFGARAAAIYRDFPQEMRGRIRGDMHRVEFPPADAVDAAQLAKGNVIHGSSMWRRSAFDQVGGYVARSDRPEDHDLFARMLGAGWRAAKADRTSLEYRQHSTDQANIRFTSHATLLHYMEKSRRLERELAAVRGTPWPWLTAHVRGTLANARRFAGVLRSEGPATALRMTREYIALRRGRAGQ
jgi:GT2 family glycosyltransferase